MISTLALAVVGTWSYAGFLAEPTPQPSPLVPPAAPPAEPPTRPAGPLLPTTPTATSRIPEDRPAARPPATPPTPTVYRLADASGQAWDHADPAFLARFVEARNRCFAIPTYVQPPPARASRCVNGRCY